MMQSPRAIYPAQRAKAPTADAESRLAEAQLRSLETKPDPTPNSVKMTPRADGNEKTPLSECDQGRAPITEINGVAPGHCLYGRVVGSWVTPSADDSFRYRLPIATEAPQRDWVISTPLQVSRSRGGRCACVSFSVRAPYRALPAQPS
jgi:hypothetical protein